MSLEFTQPHDQSVAPSLVIDMANPRILVLFRQALLRVLLKRQLMPSWACMR